MFKTHIFVNRSTDVATELHHLERVAAKHRLDPAAMSIMISGVASAVAELKQQDVDATAQGIFAAIKKTITTDDYVITLELRPSDTRPSRRRGGPLSRLFGR